MTNTQTAAPQTRNADLVRRIEGYARNRGQSARWFGLLVAKDPRLLSNLKRGRYVRPAVLQAAWERVGGTPPALPPALQHGATVRFSHTRHGSIVGTVCGTREFHSGLWVAILHGHGFDAEVLRVRASAVLAEVRESELIPLRSPPL